MGLQKTINLAGGFICSYHNVYSVERLGRRNNTVEVRLASYKDKASYDGGAEQILARTRQMIFRVETVENCLETGNPLYAEIYRGIMMTPDWADALQVLEEGQEPLPIPEPEEDPTREEESAETPAEPGEGVLSESN